MLTRLTGILEQFDRTSAVIAIEAIGVAHEILIPAYLSARWRITHAMHPGINADGCIGLNTPVTLHTIEYLESQGQGTSFIPRLIGFASTIERDFFELFTTVKGLGNKRALRALAIEPNLIADAIASRDIRRLHELPEIGKKLAETVILELREKATTFVGLLGGPELATTRTTDDGFLEARGFSTAATEAISAIMALGEPELNAERMVGRAMKRNPSLATTAEIVSAAYAAG